MSALGRDRFCVEDFEIVELPLEIPGLEPLFNGYRIVQITDLHLGHWLSPERLDGVVQLVNQQEPDLVVMTGDFVSYVLKGITERMIAAFSVLRPKEATLAVQGNHDHWMGPENVRAIFDASGVIELANDVYTIQRESARLHIAGVDDTCVGAHDLDAVLEKLPEDGPAILLGPRTGLCRCQLPVGPLCFAALRPFAWRTDCAAENWRTHTGAWVFQIPERALSGGRDDAVH